MYTAEQLELPDHLELADVVAEANRLLKLDPELDDTGDFSERTVYFYVQKGLLPRRAGRGPGTTYPKSFVHRLLFIRLLQKHGLSLDDIRERFLLNDPDALPEETVRSVLLGEMPVDLHGTEEPAIGPEFCEDRMMGPRKTDEGPPVSRARARRASASDRRRWALMRRSERLDPDAPAVERDELLQPMLARDEPGAAGQAQRQPFRLRLAPDAELIVRRELTPTQKRRLQRVGLLITDILDEDSD